MKDFFRRRYFFDSTSFSSVKEEARKKMVEVLDLQVEGKMGNHLSLHKEGRNAKSIIDEAATKIANVISVKPSEIIFTANATEANILAVNGSINAIETSQKQHAIVGTVEHSSMRHVAKILANNNFEISFALPNKKGVITTDEIKRLIKPNTKFISVLKVSNEIGTIQPIYEIANLVREYERSNDTRIVFHVDASQSFKTITLKPSAHGIDYMTICSTKIGGPQGVSALFVKNGSPFKSIFGDIKKLSIRPGTQPVVLIAGFAEAFYQNSKIVEKSYKKFREMQMFLINKMSEIIPNAKIHTINKDTKDIKEKDLNHLVPTILNIYIKGVNHDYLATLLDDRGFAVSTRSACDSLSGENPKVLKALQEANGEPPYGLRISLNDSINKSGIVKLLEEIKKSIKIAAIDS